MWQWLKDAAVEAGVMGMHFVRSTMVGLMAGVLVAMAAGWVTDGETATRIGTYAYQAGFWFWFLCCFGCTLGVVDFLTVAVLSFGGLVMGLVLRLQGRRLAAARLHRTIGRIVLERLDRDEQ